MQADHFRILVGHFESEMVDVLFCWPRSLPLAVPLAPQVQPTYNRLRLQLLPPSTAEAAADNFLAAIAQDIVERWDGMVRANAIENLEACLMLTQPSCKVPDSLVPELKVKMINMSQYFQHGNLKK